jgi:hypothetical protein
MSHDRFVGAAFGISCALILAFSIAISIANL